MIHGYATEPPTPARACDYTVVPPCGKATKRLGFPGEIGEIRVAVSIPPPPNKDMVWDPLKQQWVPTKPGQVTPPEPEPGEPRSGKLRKPVPDDEPVKAAPAKPQVLHGINTVTHFWKSLVASRRRCLRT